MSGRRIDDHSFWAGSKSKGSVFPEGVHTKDERSVEGAAMVSKYEDTAEAIREAQEMGSRKAKAHAMKPVMRH